MLRLSFNSRLRRQQMLQLAFTVCKYSTVHSSQVTRAAVCTSLGSPLVVKSDVPLASVGSNDVKIRVKYAAINYADILMCAGQYQEKLDVPFVPGAEAVGEVVEIGPQVKTVKIGDVVAAISIGGAYAADMVLNSRSVMKLPSSISPALAVTLPISYGTALMGLQRRGNLQKGETILVTAAAGAVGLAAIDIAKHMFDCKVIAAVGSNDKEKVVSDMGADHVINYATENLKDKVMEFTNKKGVDVVFEVVGGDVARDSLRSLAWEGRMIVVGFAGGDIPKFGANHLLVKNISLCGLYFGAYSKHNPTIFGSVLTDVLRNTGTGVLRPYSPTIYYLDKVNEAFNSIRSRKSKGKVVLEMSP